MNISESSGPETQPTAVPSPVRGCTGNNVVHWQDQPVSPH